MTPARSVIRLAAVLALLLAAAPGNAQEPAPARLTAAMLERDGQIDLSLDWRFQAGDDPAWSDPSFDDASWPPVDPQLPAGERPRWTGSGWFRRHLIVDEALRSGPVVLRLEAPGAAEVFLDGEKVLVTAPAMRGRAPRRGSNGGAWAEVRFTARASHLLAVRYTCDCAASPAAIGFRLSLDRPGALDSRAASLRREAALFGAFLAIPAVLALLHLGLFFFYPKSRENLTCALCLLSFTVIVSVSFADEFLPPGPLLDRFVALNLPAVLSAIYFGMLTHFAIRTRPMPRTAVWFAVVALLMVAASPFLGQMAEAWCWIVYFAASLVEIVRVEMRGAKVERDSAHPLLVGMLLLDAAIVWQILIIFEVVPPPFGFDDVYLFGVLAFSISTSLFVARSFARTSANLERRLVEVQSLSAQVIATERESARKGLEIEAARTLQRSILPASVPRLPHLEIAAKVTMATEVGGDYYDFRVAGEDSVIVAIGDAAGHGVAAGAMVTATKALFSSMADEEHLPSMLAQCDRVLRGMNVRPLYMCLLLARVTPHAVAVSSAAMPHPLLFRRSSGRVEEIGASGPPLASGLASAWQEVSTGLATGDLLLFASDGVAEAISPEGEPLGYDGIGAAFAALAVEGRPEAIIEGLLEHVESWRGSSEQTDDIAIVVVRVK